MPEEVAKFFFIGEVKIGRETFLFRLEEYLRSLAFRFADPLLNSYFDLLYSRGSSSSIEEKVLDISTFGETLDQYG